jgi:hypothetical protein
MFKKLFLTAVLVLCFAFTAVAGCIIPTGTQGWHFVPGGVQPVTANNDVPVVYHPNQPTKQMLDEFNETVAPSGAGDWSDGVVVVDRSGGNLLVHESDVICE